MQRLSRRHGLLALAAVWIIGTTALFVLPTAGTLHPANRVVVTHWAAGHLMPEHLLPEFARGFNADRRTTLSGKRIEVRVVGLDSYVQTERLVESARAGRVVDASAGEPTIATPTVDHWLAEVNHRVGRTVVDLSQTDELAVSWTGIATYREMAQCLGWPNREIGYADIVALRTDPRGWGACPTARAAWGQQPLMSYTDPSTSSTARSVLFGLYSVAAGKPTEKLAPADVTDPRVVEYVKSFQRGVDHYVPATLLLMTKMTLGYSHLYWVAEDVLVQLKHGKAPVGAPPGTEIHPLAGKDMVFIYPKEGSVAHNQPAGIVQAPWVSAEQAEAARQWIAFLREPARQAAFMDEGFRPAIPMPLRCPICPEYGLDPDKPTGVLKSIDPAVTAAIVQGWDEVKKPGVVTFVVDSSGSMSGTKLEQAKRGVVQALDGLSSNTHVGLVTFASGIKTAIPIAPVQANRFTIAQDVGRLQASGNTALYEALDRAIAMTDDAPVDDAIRGVVVLTDGQANGQLRLHDVATMTSRDEVPIVHFEGPGGTDRDGVAIGKSDVLGMGLKRKTKHPIHVFYLGVGGDADLEVGRILAEATNSVYQGTTEKGLAEVLATFGKYF